MITLKVGSIISSPEFAMGISTECLLLNELVPVTLIDSEIGSYNKDRSSSRYVVEQITMEGEDSREGIPNRPFIIARKLKKNHKYDPAGELISFSYPNEYTSNPINKLYVHGQMKRMFV